MNYRHGFQVHFEGHDFSKARAPLRRKEVPGGLLCLRARVRMVASGLPSHTTICSHV